MTMTRPLASRMRSTVTAKAGPSGPCRAAAIALTPLLGADAVYWAFPIGSGSSLLMTAAYFRYGGWRVNRPIEQLALAENGPA